MDEYEETIVRIINKLIEFAFDLTDATGISFDTVFPANDARAPTLAEIEKIVTDLHEVLTAP